MLILKMPEWKQTYERKIGGGERDWVQYMCSSAKIWFICCYINCHVPEVVQGRRQMMQKVGVCAKDRVWNSVEENREYYFLAREKDVMMMLITVSYHNPRHSAPTGDCWATFLFSGCWFCQTWHWLFHEPSMSHSIEEYVDCVSHWQSFPCLE